MMNGSPKPALFLDRDGVINFDSDNYILSWSEFMFRPHVLEVLSKIAEFNIYVFIVTNQSAIARGYMTIETLIDIHSKMLNTIQKTSGRIDRIYFCPHHPDEGCHCRKPQTGMLEQAAREYSIDPHKLFIVGDKASDIIAGKNFGCYSILVESSRIDDEITKLAALGLKSDIVVKDIKSVLTILEEQFL